MIRNVIFDLGNVLLCWNPGEYLIESGYSAERAQYILDTVFRSREWFSLDNGDLSREEAIERMDENSTLNKAEISSLFDLSLDIIYPIAKNVNLLPELRKKGYKLYYLSNYPLDFFLDTKKIYSFFDLFDGGIISAEVRFSKPDPEIYNVLMGKYGLLPEESLFIDDNSQNVEAAVKLGMRGFCTEGEHDIEPGLKELLDERD
jgi:HAD superfamily hydrolase (TIGR01509 family)